MAMRWSMGLALIALVGCVESNPGSDPVDAGPDGFEADTGPEVDAGPDPDAAPAVDAEPVADAEPDAAPMPVDALEWGACPRGIPREGNPRCATTDVPLQWDQPDGPTIELIVMRYANGPDPIGQLWLLDGGPGGSGISFGQAGLDQLFAPAGYEVFVPSHRGTGLSTPLECDGRADSLVGQLRTCGAALEQQWGDGLAGFRASEAARDLGHLIGRVNAAEGGRKVVYGISYGTYWGLRYLQAFPDQADAVLLDGVLDFESEVWLNGKMADEVGFYLMDLCAENPGCNGAFDEAPRDAVRTAFAKAADGTCAPLAGFPPDQLAAVLGFMITAAAELRPMVPAFIARAARCNDQDAAELEVFIDSVFENLFGGFRPTRLSQPIDWPRRQFQRGGLEFNQTLYFAVLMADLVRPWELDPVDVFEEAGTTYFSGPPDDPATMLAVWPDIALPDDHLTPPETDTPILFTRGLLDMQTVPPWAERAAGHFEGEHQHLVTFPYGGHGAIDGIPTIDGGECGMQVMLSFIADPEGPLDTGCLDRLERPDLAGERPDTQQISAIFFGTPQLMPGG